MTLTVRSRTAAVAALLGIAVAVVPGAPAHAETIRQQQWHLRALQIDQVHRITKGAGVVVAVLDTGVEANHPDLRGRVLKGAGFGEAAGSTLDYDGHGTGMAGTIAAKGGGANHALGIAPAAKILPGRISVKDTATSSAINDGIRWATDQGAKVINISFAADARALDSMYRAVEYALSKDVVIVAGAGNRPDGHRTVGHPASIPGVVAVGATDRSGALWSGSVTGPQLAIAAPGVRVVTSSSRRGGSKTGYGAGTGTSSATAVVAGAVALIRSRYPDMKAPDVINRLLATADDAGPNGRDDQYGFGRLDILGALTADVRRVSANPLGSPAGASPQAGAASDADEARPNPLTTEAIGGLIIIGFVVLVLPIAFVVLLVILIRGRRRRPAMAGAPMPPMAGAPPPGTPGGWPAQQPGAPGGWPAPPAQQPGAPGGWPAQPPGAPGQYPPPGRG
jgi:type VII secretion-associated serine protease mycosin